MVLLLAPFNNAMRLGQGFNSYTQQICVDDAVVTDPNRSENVITNDGTTMRIIAQNSMKPSAWNRQPEVLLDNRAEDILRRANLLKAREESSEIVADKDIIPAKKTAESQRVATPGKIGVDLAKSSKPVAESEDKDGTTEEELSEDQAEDAKPAEPSAAAPASDKDTKHEKVEKSDSESIEEINHRELEEVAAGTKHEESSKKPTISIAERVRASFLAEGIKKNDGLNASNKAIITPEKTNNPSKKIPSAPAGERLHTTIVQAQAETKQEKLAAAQKAAERKAADEKVEQERLEEQRKHQLALEKESRDEERKIREESRKEKELIRAEKRQWDQQRREENRKAITAAADLKAISLQDLEKIKAQNQFADRFAGMVQDQQEYTFDMTSPRGPSQTVVYTSKFVDRLSDVTDDMCISGSLSIKASKIGGSGRGSFVDSDKFKQSDLNFYISVKVINQTQNFKDALVFNPLRSVTPDNFKDVYGDSFISGFLEGGEFNALVSMKIMNKAKMTDIKAEAKVAFTAGPLAVEAEANVGIARSNIETNTETTIQVSWCGGGHIKPPEQQWDIQSLMAAAARFPDLVADCPQRTYAILTKYESLRSFIALKPAGYSPLQYENAQIYTNALLDSFMSYKAIYKKIGEDIFQIQGKTMELVPWEKVDQEAAAAAAEGIITADAKIVSPSAAPAQTGSEVLNKQANDSTRFEASLSGLSNARKAIRRQMMYIVNEVDFIEKDPKQATDDTHEEPFQSPVVFEARIPKVVVAARFRTKSQPLTGKRLQAKTQTEQEQKDEAEREEELAKAIPLYTPADVLTMEEKTAFDQILEQSTDIGEKMRVTSGVGRYDLGKRFNNLDFVKPDWQVKSFSVEVAKGAITFVEVWYENGLHLAKGKTLGGRKKTLVWFQPGERITSATLEHGVLSGGKETESRLLSIRFFTNRGRRLVAQATKNEDKGSGKVEKDGVLYEFVKTQYFDSPLSTGTVKGFFGNAEEADQQNSGIIRLGLIWGQTSEAPFDMSTASEAAQSYDYTGMADNEDLQSLQTEAVQQRQELIQVKQQLKDSNEKADRLQGVINENQRSIPDPKNNLSSGLDGVAVFILHQGSFKAFDKGPGVRLHGWDFNRDNSNQKLILRRVNSDSNSPWLIVCDGSFLEFTDSGNEKVAMCGSRRSDGWADCQEWYIGTNPGEGGSFMIENVRYGTCLNMRGTSNGATICSWSRNPSDGEQKFLIFAN